MNKKNEAITLVSNAPIFGPRITRNKSPLINNLLT